MGRQPFTPSSAVPPPPRPPSVPPPALLPPPPLLLLLPLLAAFSFLSRLACFIRCPQTLLYLLVPLYSLSFVPLLLCFSEAYIAATIATNRERVTATAETSCPTFAILLVSSSVSTVSLSLSKRFNSDLPAYGAPAERNDMSPARVRLCIRRTVMTREWTGGKRNNRCCVSFDRAAQPLR